MRVLLTKNAGIARLLRKKRPCIPEGTQGQFYIMVLQIGFAPNHSTINLAGCIVPYCWLFFNTFTKNYVLHNHGTFLIRVTIAGRYSLNFFNPFRRL